MPKLRALLKELDSFELIGEENPNILSLTADSREVEPGSLFVALKGFKVDGHSFLTEVVEKGAAAVVVEGYPRRDLHICQIVVPDTRIALARLANAFFDYPSQKMTVIGVTGTNGKTTTTNLIRSIMKEAGKEGGLIGTIKNYIGDEALPVTNTTPESIELQRLFAKMVEARLDYIVMEVSSHALDLHRVEGIDFDVAVFTNLTQDHLDYHHTMEEYMRAKGKLFAGLGKIYKTKKVQPKKAIINIDDPHHKYFIELTDAEVITYGLSPQAVVRAEDLHILPSGVSFTLLTPAGKLPLKLQLTGKFSVYNALAAAAACLALGIELSTIKSALENVSGVPGRFERIDLGQPFTVIVDYAHTPDSLENILQTAAEFVKGRIIIVFGCGGDRDKTKRPIMGEVAGRYADYCIITSDNPRTEDPESIIKEVEIGVLKAGKTRNEYATITERYEAIKHAIEMANENDIVLIAGKGHEDYQIIGSDKKHFDDREVAREILKMRLLKNETIS